MPVNNFAFGKHAVERILDMAVDAVEVRECLEHPLWIQKSSRADNRQLYFGDRITCVVQDGNSVVTVLWRTKEGWKSDLSAGDYGGRSPRED